MIFIDGKQFFFHAQLFQTLESYDKTWHKTIQVKCLMQKRGRSDDGQWTGHIYANKQTTILLKYAFDM